MPRCKQQNAPHEGEAFSLQWRVGLMSDGLRFANSSYKRSALPRYHSPAVQLFGRYF